MCFLSGVCLHPKCSEIHVYESVRLGVETAVSLSWIILDYRAAAATWCTHTDTHVTDTDNTNVNTSNNISTLVRQWNLGLMNRISSCVMWKPRLFVAPALITQDGSGNRMNFTNALNAPPPKTSEHHLNVAELWGKSDLSPHLSLKQSAGASSTLLEVVWGSTITGHKLDLHLLSFNPCEHLQHTSNWLLGTLIRTFLHQHGGN